MYHDWGNIFFLNFLNANFSTLSEKFNNKTYSFLFPHKETKLFAAMLKITSDPGVLYI